MPGNSPALPPSCSSPQWAGGPPGHFVRVVGPPGAALACCSISLHSGSGLIVVRGRCCGHGSALGTWDSTSHMCCLVPVPLTLPSRDSQQLSGSLSPSRPAITLSTIMLLTQKATSLGLDIHEGVVLLQQGQGLLQRVLPLCSYLLFFPALLGGPLCSFSRFRAQVESSEALPCRLRAVGQRCLCALALQGLRAGLVAGLAGRQGCAGLGCLPCLWARALLLRLAYYMHWVLDEALLEAAGFGPEAGQGDLSLHDLWMLETTHRLAVFARTWNKSTSRWLRRLVFQRCPAQPLLATFAFSAWWHGLRPGQVFGFLCWAVMVEADYRIHPFLSARATSQSVKLLYRGTTWVFTQLIVAYILVAVETESFSMLCLLWTSCNSILPLSYGLTLMLLLLVKKPKQN